MDAFDFLIVTNDSNTAQNFSLFKHLVDKRNGSLANLSFPGWSPKLHSDSEVYREPM